MLKYILEIKNRFILILVNLFSTALIVYFYKETILFIIIEPSLLLNMKKSLETFYFIFTGVTEVFSVYLKLIIFLSLQILYIYLIYHFFIYLSPAFFYFEYLYFKFIIKLTFFVWMIFGMSSNYFLIPFSWNFFLSFQNLTLAKSFVLHFEAKLKEYLLFYISFYNVWEFYFQFFVCFLITLDYLKSNLKIIKKFRKVYYYCFIIFSTITSPPELLSQVFISLIFISIYELLILFFLIKSVIMNK